MTATGSGSLLTATPFGKPEFAFDGDRRTAWTTGDFGGAVGQSVTVTLDEPAEVGSIVLRPVLSEPGVQVAGVRVRVDAGTVEVPVPAEPEVRVDVPDATTPASPSRSPRSGGSGSTRWASGRSACPGSRSARSPASPGPCAGWPAPSPPPTGPAWTPPRSTWS